MKEANFFESEAAKNQSGEERKRLESRNQLLQMKINELELLNEQNRPEEKEEKKKKEVLPKKIPQSDVPPKKIKIANRGVDLTRNIRLCRTTQASRLRDEAIRKKRERII